MSITMSSGVLAYLVPSLVPPLVFSLTPPLTPLPHMSPVVNYCKV